MPTELDITQLLINHRNGDKAALDALIPVIYQHLKKIADRQRRRLWNGDTLNSTALVHEAYLKLIQKDALNAQNRVHFYALCSLCIRQIIVNYLEQKTAQKRGHQWEKISLSDACVATEYNIDTILAVDKVLKKLSHIDAKLSNLVQMRFFGGMSESEIALATESTERTVRRNWSKAKALLNNMMSENPDSHVQA